MLSKEQQKMIIDRTRGFVEDYLLNTEIDWNSKEIGHKHGEAIESHIVENFSKMKGFDEPMASREFGDLYFTHPVFDQGRDALNIKFGYQKDGKPNLCALNRLIRAVTGRNPRYPDKFHETFDSYWILSVNLLDKNRNFEIHLFDVYQNLDLVAFDAGPGQLMINETMLYKNGYQIINNGGTDMNLLKSKLFKMLEKGHQSKIEHLQTIKENAKEFLQV